MKTALSSLAALYTGADLKKASENVAERKAFTDKAERIFEAERNAFYANGYSDGEEKITSDEILTALGAFNRLDENGRESTVQPDGGGNERTHQESG